MVVSNMIFSLRLLSSPEGGTGSMVTTELEKRLASIEDRLTSLESRFRAPPRPPAAAPAAKKAEPRAEGSLVTSVLGWGGALALVLAASYLIRLAIDAGWLTPERQVACAAIAGLAMIAAGFALRDIINRQYAGLLPAGGIVILFLSIYGGHLYYGFVGSGAAAAGVIAVCIAALWLCRAFESDLYALFAVAGSYSAPFLLARLGGSITDLVIYYSAWGLVFGVFAIWHGRRLIYLLALYLALIGFDLIWRARGIPGEWVAALVFQTVQFALFGVATAAFSIRHQAPLTTDSALAHLPPLLLFYFLQYSLLDSHMPAAAPWIAVASAAVLALIYGAARVALERPLPGGELLLWSYVALVLFHAGYVESVPKAWAPWVAFIALPLIGAAALRRGIGMDTGWALWLAVALIFLVNYLRVVLDTDLQGVAARQVLAILYALELYAGYYFLRGGSGERFGALLLYAGHVSAMAAALHLIGTPIVESTVWAILALGCLGLALAQHDRALGQSSLLVFGATAAKVLLYDLSGAPPVARIVSLVVLGVAFYAGGLLYQKISREAAGA
jgi:uncharacterized membrane protein